MLRPLLKSDLKQVLAIEQAVHIAPWTEDIFQIVFRTGYIGWVLEVDQQIIGFIIVSQNVDECHILNVCVARPSQHKGYGKQLLMHALQHAQQLGVQVIYLEVRRSNSRAIKLYEQMGFQQIGERTGYYPTVSGLEDALIFAKMLNRY